MTLSTLHISNPYWHRVLHSSLDLYQDLMALNSSAVALRCCQDVVLGSSVQQTPCLTTIRDLLAHAFEHIPGSELASIRDTIQQTSTLIEASPANIAMAPANLQVLLSALETHMRLALGQIETGLFEPIEDQLFHLETSRFCSLRDLLRDDAIQIARHFGHSPSASAGIHNPKVPPLAYSAYVLWSIMRDRTPPTTSNPLHQPLPVWRN